MPQGTNLEWTDDIIGRLKALWADGLPTAEIGRRIEVSKNAVVGKVHRLKLPSRPSPIRSTSARPSRPPREKRPPAPRLQGLLAGPSARVPLRPSPAPVPRQLPSVPGPKPGAVTSLRPTLSNKPCCWPLGEPGTPGFHFCEDRTLTGRPYCEAHCGEAYVKPRTSAEARQH